jgi:hypothetical protein
LIALSDLGTGPEVVQTAMYLQLCDRLEAELARQQAIWDRYDEFIAERQGEIYEQTVLQLVQKRSLVRGTRRSTLKLPTDYFPVVAVMCDNSGPTAESATLDLGGVSGNRVYIEVVVKSDPYDPDDVEAQFRQEGVVDRRVKRTSQAAAQCVMADPSLGAVTPALGQPRIAQTDSFAIKGTKPDDQGRTWLFSLARIDFVGDIYFQFDQASTFASIPLPG